MRAPRCHVLYVSVFYGLLKFHESKTTRYLATYCVLCSIATLILLVRSATYRSSCVPLFGPYRLQPCRLLHASTVLEHRPNGVAACSVGHKGSCWWKPPHMSSCEDYYQATHPNWTVGHWSSINSDTGSAVPLPGAPLGVAVPVPDPLETDTDTGSPDTHHRSLFGERLETESSQHGEATVENARHETGAGQRWKEYYTQEIGDLVYELYREDFETFGYRHEVFST